MRMFVSVGTHPQQFDRLLQEIDALIGKGELEADVFAQIGNSGHEPKNFAFKRFIDDTEYGRHFAEADVVISHGGAGTIINALRNEKPLVIVPRLQGFGEHTNDHQLDLALALDSGGKAIAVEEIRGLESAIRKARHFKPRLASERDSLIKEIQDFLENK